MHLQNIGDQITKKWKLNRFEELECLNSKEKMLQYVPLRFPKVGIYKLHQYVFYLKDLINNF